MADSARNNRFSAVFTPEDLQNVETAKEMIRQAIMTKLVSLGSGGLGGLPSVSEANRAFTDAVAECVATHPEFLPPYSDAVEFMKDVNASAALRPFRDWVRELLELLDDSIGLADGEAYVGGSLPYYANAKAGAKLGVPAAVTIVTKLSPRFAAQRGNVRSTARKASHGGQADTPGSKD